MKIPLTDCPPITDTKSFFKAKTVVYIDVLPAPVEVAASGFKLIEIYGTPGKLYRYFKKGYLIPQEEGTEYMPLILWEKPLQEILCSFRVFDFSEWNLKKDKIFLTEQQMRILYIAARNFTPEEIGIAAFSEN